MLHTETLTHNAEIIYSRNKQNNFNEIFQRSHFYYRHEYFNDTMILWVMGYGLTGNSLEA